MKKTFFLVGLLIAAHASAFADEAHKITVRCNLADLAKENNPNILTETYELEMEKTVQVATYNGHVYEISAFDFSGNGGEARFELLISARDAQTNAVIGSAATVFSNQVPDLIYQDGPNILLRCSKR